MTENQTDEKREKAKRQILDAFFHFRRPLPEEGYIQENRSTQELWDMLRDMYVFTTEEIADYLIEHGYAPITELDGSVRWAIWRIIATVE